MAFGVRCGFAIALLAAAPAPVFSGVPAGPLTAEALAGRWTLAFTPGGKGVTVQRRGPDTGPIVFLVDIAAKRGRLTGCSVRQDPPSVEAPPARCTLERGRLVIRLAEGGNGMAFNLASVAGRIAGDVSLKMRLLPMSPKIGKAVLTRAQ